MIAQDKFQYAWIGVLDFCVFSTESFQYKRISRLTPQILLQEIAKENINELMGNKFSKKPKKSTSVVKEKRRKKDFPLKEQESTTGWRVTKEHRAAVEEIFLRYHLQDVLDIVFLILGEQDNVQVYCSLTRPDLYGINNDNTLSRNYYICPDWLKFQIIILFVIEKQKIMITIMGTRDGMSELWFDLLKIWHFGKNDVAIEDQFIKCMQLNNDHNCYVEIMDVAMQEEFLGVRDQYIRSSDCVIISHKIRSSIMLEHEIEKHLSRIRRFQDVTTIVAGTDTELRDTNPLEYQKCLALMFDCCKRNNICYIETSGKNNINIEFLFHFAVYNVWFNSFKD
ncbi:hypothetical protein RFI_10789 [Reticulomyxa filosa]|uniref:Uncharacterized protein n=1 Tax=Reticulomyxa filosa TaxID=46433 RepID=X6NKU6_RETFI|nr:hypothetical protein RFI_10789 [Reticulomyxa filosa]|eukprot:ETO26349.1 hypothetical protein RFI_10789 [Reticulomyxa filosa]